jgi:hypothetical protein
MGAFHNVGENGNKGNENENNVGESVCQRLFPYIFSVFLAFSLFYMFRKHLQEKKPSVIEG